MIVICVTFLRIHPDHPYDPRTEIEEKKPKNDLALIKLSRVVEFIENEILPICLPHKGFHDIPKSDKKLFQAFVSGWGSTVSSDNPCSTNEFGPAPNTVCTDFLYEGEVEEGNKTHPSCVKKPSPSSQHPICIEFNEWANKNTLELWKDNFERSYRIVYWNKSAARYFRGYYTNVTCYNPSRGEHGWCGTCYDFGFKYLNPEDNGFCSDSGIQQALTDYVFQKLGRKLSKHGKWNNYCHRVYVQNHI